MIRKFTDHPTVERVAMDYTVSESQVDKAKWVRRKGSVALIEAVESGGLTLHVATKILKTVSGDQHATIVQQVLAAKHGPVVHV